MKRYPKIGTRIRVTGGEYAGRQGRTDKTVGGRGRIDLTLLGGVHKLGVSAKLEHVELDSGKVRKLLPRPLKAGDRLLSQTGLVYPIGHAMTVRRVRDGEFDATSDYGQPIVLRPTKGFEKRWAHMDGHPIELRTTTDKAEKT